MLSYVEKGDDTRGFADLREGITLTPDNYWDPYWQGVELAMRGRDDEALSSVDKAITLKGDEVNPYLLRSELREKKGDTPGAIADLTRSLELDPNYKAPRSNRALLYQELGKYDLSLADYDKLLTLEPGDAYYAQRRADVMEKMASGPAAKPCRAAAEREGGRAGSGSEEAGAGTSRRNGLPLLSGGEQYDNVPRAPTDPNNLHGPGSALVRRVYSADAIA